MCAGNEPSFATPFLYNYVPGNHWKTVNESRAIVDAFYSDARNGYPGNIDSGALPSWLVFNLIGLVSAKGIKPGNARAAADTVPSIRLLASLCTCSVLPASLPSRCASSPGQSTLRH